MKPLQKHHSPGTQVLPLGERKAAWGEEGWAATFLKADGLTSHRGNPPGKQEEEGAAG